MTTLPWWATVQEGDTQTRVTRRVPSHWPLAWGATFVSMAGLFALEPGLGLSGLAALALGTTFSIVTLPGRIQRRAASSVVRALRRRVDVTR